MIFYTKLTKRKKYNISSSFTFLELLFIIIIIGILAASVSYNIIPNKLYIAADEIINNIRFTQSLALKDDKYYPFSSVGCSSSSINAQIECNRSKYWFKQWWQLRFFTNTKKEFFYEVFSDSPYITSSSTSGLFDRIGNPVSEFAFDPLSQKYLTSNYTARTDEDLNLSKYGIVYITFNDKNVTTNNSKRIIFDSNGNIFLTEGLQGDGGDINPLDYTNRKLLINPLHIKLYTKKECLDIVLTPSGETTLKKCNN